MTFHITFLFSSLPHFKNAVLAYEICVNPLLTFSSLVGYQFGGESTVTCRFSTVLCGLAPQPLCFSKGQLYSLAVLFLPDFLLSWSSLSLHVSASHPSVEKGAVPGPRATGMDTGVTLFLCPFCSTPRLLKAVRLPLSLPEAQKEAGSQENQVVIC